MNINEMKETKYLKKEDVMPDKTVTIDRIEKTNVAMENQAPEMKHVMYFRENIASDGSNKPIVLNWTNIQLCANATGSEETDSWPGKQIILFNDPNVSFGGKLTGGIRIRAINQGAVNQPQNNQNNYFNDLPIIPDEKFDIECAVMRKSVDEGRKTPEGIIATLSTRYTLSDRQKNTINGFEKATFANDNFDDDIPF